MDYAITLLLPILGGLFLGMWLTSQYAISPLWTVVLAILGMVGGIGIMWKRYTYPELYGEKGLPKITPTPSAEKLADPRKIRPPADESDEDGSPVKRGLKPSKPVSTDGPLGYRELYKSLDDETYDYENDNEKP